MKKLFSLQEFLQLQENMNACVMFAALDSIRLIESPELKEISNVLFLKIYSPLPLLGYSTTTSTTRYSNNANPYLSDQKLLKSVMFLIHGILLGVSAGISIVLFCKAYSI